MSVTDGLAAPVGAERDARPDAELTPEQLVSRWRGYAESASIRAMRMRKYGDVFGAELQLARGQVRRKATELLRKAAPLEAARQMHTAAHATREYYPPPIMGLSLDEVDGRCLRYTRARTWQACAWALDPGLPEVQREWPD